MYHRSNTDLSATDDSFSDFSVDIIAFVRSIISIWLLKSCKLTKYMKTLDIATNLSFLRTIMPKNLQTTVYFDHKDYPPLYEFYWSVVCSLSMEGQPLNSVSYRRWQVKMSVIILFSYIDTTCNFNEDFVFNQGVIELLDLTYRISQDLSYSMDLIVGHGLSKDFNTLGQHHRNWKVESC